MDESLMNFNLFPLFEEDFLKPKEIMYIPSERCEKHPCPFIGMEDVIEVDGLPCPECYDESYIATQNGTVLSKELCQWTEGRAWGEALAWIG